MLLFVVCAGLLVAFANGANDNAKGVATMIGGRIAGLRPALLWANGTTALGALAAIPVALFVNSSLLKAFAGGGLLPASFPIDAKYLLSVGLAAACTVLLATRFGLPVSTTHSLLGALLGAGLIAVGPASIVWAALGTKFVLPLILSPLLASASAIALFTISGIARRGASVSTENHRMLILAHYATSGLVSFARGLNDTPKIAAILVAAGTLGATSGFEGQARVVTLVMGGVVLAMLAGGWFFAPRVARTMSEQIAEMDGKQSLLASIVTAILVFLASLNGLPVSTTHVAVGSLFGIGIGNRTAKLRTMATILVAWITTLPLAAGLGAAVYALVRVAK